jgi:hypothetical protein
MGKDGILRAVLSAPRRCGCNRMTYFVINRDGKSRCIECDRLYLEALAKCAGNTTPTL